MRVLFGILIFLADIAVFVMGVYLTLAGLTLLGPDTGAGTISIVIQRIGEIRGVNGHVVVFVAGVTMMIVSVILALQAFKESKAKLGRVSAKGVIHYIVPLP
jgi:hypothetical protein